MKTRLNTIVKSLTMSLLLLPTAALAIPNTYANWGAATGGYWPGQALTEEKSPFGDPDKDGEINLREYVAGTSPLSHGTALTVSHPVGTTQFSFVEVLNHPSAYRHLRVTDSNGTYAIPVPSSATQTAVSGSSTQYTTAFSLPGVTSCDVIVSTTPVTFRQTTPIKLEYLTGGSVKLSWEDRSTVETGYLIYRISYASTGAWTSSTQIADLSTGPLTTYTDTAVASLSAGYYAYTVIPYRPDVTYPTLYREYGPYSDYSMMYYTSNSSTRDMDLDFIPDAQETGIQSTQDPFDSMRQVNGFPLWPAGTPVAVVRPSPSGSEYSSIGQAISSTSSAKLIINVYPGTYTGAITIPSGRHFLISGVSSGIGPDNKVVLQVPNASTNLLINNGGCLLRNIIFKGAANATKYMIWAYGNDVFTRTEFENCIFTGHTSSSYSPVGIDAGRNRFTHCSFLGNSTASPGTYGAPQAIFCDLAAPTNIVENCIFRSSGTVTSATPEVGGEVWYTNNFVRGDSVPENKCDYCITDNPGLVSNNNSQVGGLAYSTDVYSRSYGSMPKVLLAGGFPVVGDDIDGEPRNGEAQDAGADEWFDNNMDNIADILSGPEDDPGNLFAAISDSFADADGDGNLNGDELPLNRWNRGSWSTGSSFFNSSVATPDEYLHISILNYPWATAPARPASPDGSIIVDFWDTRTGDLRIYARSYVNSYVIRPIAILRSFSSSMGAPSHLTAEMLSLGKGRKLNDWGDYHFIWVVNRYAYGAN